MAAVSIKGKLFLVMFLPFFLQQLNPDARFSEGEEIVVSNVETMVIPVVPLKHPVKPGTWVLFKKPSI